MEASEVARLTQHSGVRRRVDPAHAAPQRQALQSCTAMARLRNLNVERHASQEPPDAAGQLIVSATLVVLAAQQGAAAEDRPRARDSVSHPASWSQAAQRITDVAGVKVGHVTLISGDRVRTGVTALLPHDEPVSAEGAGSRIVGNAFGKLCRLDAGAGARNDRNAGRSHEHSRGRAAIEAWSRGLLPSLGTNTCALCERDRRRNERRRPQRHQRWSRDAVACDRGDPSAAAGPVTEGGGWRRHRHQCLWLEGWHRHRVVTRPMHDAVWTVGVPCNRTTVDD